MPAFETVLLSVQDHIAKLVINRPAQKNSLTIKTSRELYEALSSLQAEYAVRVLILTGSGGSFCPGADINHVVSGAEDEVGKSEYFNVPRFLHQLPFVTIAAINGSCAGAGFGYAAACDFRFAAETAMFNTAFLTVGASGDMALPWTLPRIVGATKARELCFFPEKFNASHAKEMGFVTDVFPAAVLMNEVMSRATRIAASAPIALRSMKQNFVSAETLAFSEYLDIEVARHRASLATKDSKEAFRAFAEKRAPVFHGS
jgi:2-(1,2-epoxy-1,2-dihydrophenyl)acetyl-CoA isomerase